MRMSLLCDGWGDLLWLGVLGVGAEAILAGISSVRACAPRLVGSALAVSCRWEASRTH